MDQVLAEVVAVFPEEVVIGRAPSRLDPSHRGHELRVRQIRLAEVHLLLSRERQVRVASRRALVHARDLPRPSLVPELGHLRRVRDALHLDVRVADGNPEPLAQRRRDPADGHEAEEPVLAVDGEGAEEVGEEVDADPERRLRVVGVVYGRIAVDRAPARGSRGGCPVVSRRPPIALFPIAIAVLARPRPFTRAPSCSSGPAGAAADFLRVFAIRFRIDRASDVGPAPCGMRDRAPTVRSPKSEPVATSAHMSGLATSFSS